MFGQSKKLLGCLILGSLLVYASSYGQASTPGISSNSPKQQATEKNKKPETDKRGTEQSPVVVKILPSTDTKGKPTEIPRECNCETTFKWWPISTEGWLVLFTAGVFAATYLLYRATDRLATNAEETSKRELRAYVFMRISPKAYPPNNPTLYANSLTVTNTGKTWARNLTIQKAFIRQESGDGSDPFDLMVQQSDAPRMVMGPGEILELQFGEVKFSDFPELLKGTYRISYIAVARYQDALSPSIIRQTQLSCRMNVDAQGGISFSYLPTHNCVDDDCPS